MFPLVRLGGLLPGSSKRGDAKNFGIESARIGAGKNVAGIVGALVLEHPDGIVDEIWIDQRAIGCDAHHCLRGIQIRRLIVTIQHVVLRTTKTRNLKRRAFPNYGFVHWFDCGGHYTLVKQPGAAQTTNDSRQHSFPSQICKHFTWEPGAGHSGLDHGDNLSIGLSHSGSSRALPTNYLNTFARVFLMPSSLTTCLIRLARIMVMETGSGKVPTFWALRRPKSLPTTFCSYTLPAMYTRGFALAFRTPAVLTM